MSGAFAVPSILLVGCGRMGGAMLAGWREQGLAPSVIVDPAIVDPPIVDSGAPAGLAGAGGLTVVAGPEAIPGGFAPSAVIFAVKPQMARETLPAYARFAGRSVMLSIMAGQTISGMRALLGADAAIVRAMPNTPAAIRQGVTVATPNDRVDAGQRALCETLLRAVGDVAWVADEALIDAVTAVSGSGPAYVFLLAELMERAGIEQGLPPDLARLLARKTVSGSGALLGASAEDAAALRRAVTSPNGTTQAALSVLMDDAAWPSSVSAAIAAAARRSRELAG